MNKKKVAQQYKYDKDTTILGTTPKDLLSYTNKSILGRESNIEIIKFIFKIQDMKKRSGVDISLEGIRKICQRLSDRKRDARGKGGGRMSWITDRQKRPL